MTEKQIIMDLLTQNGLGLEGTVGNCVVLYKINDDRIISFYREDETYSIGYVESVDGDFTPLIGFTELKEEVLDCISERVNQTTKNYDYLKK